MLCTLQTKLLAQTGECLNFNGGNTNYVQVSPQSFGANWSAEVWLRPTNAFSIIWNTVLGQAYWNGPQGFAIAVQSGSVFVNGPQGVIISTPISNGVWTHVAVTYNNGIFAFYKNGLLVGNQISPFTNSSTPFFIGARNNNNVTNNSSMVDFFYGDIDEIRIWSTTRSQCDIMSYMNCEIPSTATGLVANYHFNQGISGVLSVLNYLTGANFNLNDNSGNGNTGSLTGFGLSLSGSSNWTAPGSPAQGLSTPTIPTPEINVKGNSVSIVDGDVSSSSTDFTDFNGQYTRTFVIESTGSGTLNVGTPVFTGANASDFSITVVPGSVLAASTGTTSFVVAFTPTSVGTKSALVNIYNSDCSEPIYDFVITATAVTASALDFDGVNDYVETGANLAELGQADFTIEAWIKTTGSSEGIVTCANSNTTWETGEKSFYLDASGTPMFVGWGNNYIVGNIAVNNGVWHHVAVVWDYNSGVGSFGKMYVDGVDHTSGSSYAGNNTNIGTFKIGKQNYGAGEAPNNFDGTIDEVRIWNRALCLPEIINNMNCELPTPTSQVGLNGYYKFNTGIAFGTNTTVTTAPDAAVFANNGTLTNFVLTGGVSSNWVNPGGVTSGSTCSAYLDEEINLQGNSTIINSGDITPSITDHTDFGLVNVGSVLSRTFIIQNVGTAALSISAYSLSGANASDFTITTNPGVSVPSAGNTSIVVSFSASVTGLKTASLTIANSDCDEGVYRFVINATGVVPGAALNFDGVNDYVQMADPNFGTSDCTIETWFNTTTGGGYLITTRSSEPGPSGNWFAIGVGSGTNAGAVSIELAASTGTYGGVSTPPGCFIPGTWSHLAVVRSGSQIYIYVNGILRASATEPVTRNFVTGNNVLRLGGWVNFNTAWYNGSVDETRLWTVARTQCEIQSYMNCEIPTTASNLVGNYHFNQGYNALSNSTITTLTDASASGRTGAITNFSLTGTNSNWVAPGGVVSSYTTVIAPVAEIDIRGNGNSIVDGNTSTSAIDFTDFSGALTRTFTIHNTVGGGTLNIGNLFITGTNASQFSITSLPSASLVGTGSTSFVAAFTPTSTGVKSATININNNDCSEPLYDFVITATAVAGSALTFDGVDDRLDVSGILNPQSSNYSLECWFKINSDASRPTLFKHAASTGTGRSHLFVDNTLHTLGTITGGISLTGTTTVSPGIWYHAAYTWNGTTRKIYLNGILESWDNTPLEPTTGSDWVFGVNAGNNFLDGSMDEIRMWNTERTQCEIQTYMNCEIPTTASGLVANYHFNQGVAGGNNPGINTLTDAAGANNASLLSFSLTGTNSNWTGPGGVVSGFSTTSAPTPTISLTGNGNLISNNSTSPLTTNFTDFGSASSRTFVIQNAPSGTLNLFAPFLSGTNASEFSVTVLPSGSLSASGTTSFVVAFTPTTGGVRSATVNIYSNDCVTPLFKFAIQGTPPPAEAIAFSGGTDYIDLGSSASLKPTAALTAEAWVYSSTWPSSDQTILGNTENAGYGLFTRTTGQLEGLVRRNSVWASVTTPLSGLSVGWHHVALTYDGRFTKLYVDGVLKSQDDAGAIYTISYIGNNTLIGAEASSGSAPISGWYFSGKVDEVRFWSVARTQCEIQSFMQCEIPGSTSGLVANYHFNEGAAALNNATVTALTDALGAITGTLNNVALTGTLSNWVSAGAVVSGFTTSSAPTATLNVYGNGNIVPMGATTSTTNYTDFDLATNRTFLVHNLGVSPLYVNTITFSGVNASNFSVSSLPSASIAGSSNSPFVISFTPTAVGSQSAIVNISSNDCANPNFSFVITASTVPAEALNFNGINDVVDCGTNSSLDITVGTWEAWVKLTDLSDNRRIFFKETSDGSGIGAYESYFLNSDGKFHGDLKIGSTTHYVIGNLSPVINTWYHVAATYDGTSFKLYVNGVLDGITTSPSGPMNPGTGHLSLGAAVSATGSSQMDGIMDEARLWNVARTQCEIQTYMNCEIPGTASGLIANYHFNQGVPSGSNTSVTTLIDATGNNPATLVGFSLTGGSVSNWVSLSQISSGFTTAVTPNASISVNGNGNAIPIGVTTSTTNFTDFGSTSNRNYVLQNAAATGTLYLNSVSLSGANASDFTVTTLPSSAITTGSTNFVIDFIPTAIGTRSAIVTINSSDCISPNYSFVITASATPGEALNIDGIDDNIGTAVFNTQTANNTLQAKVLWNGNNGQNHMAVYNGNSSTNGYGIYVGVSGAVSILFGSINFYPANYTLTPGVWTSLTAVIKSGLAEFYVNGILTNSTSVSGPNTPTASFNIGCNSVGTEIFNGSIDEVLLWNRALSQCEIQTNQNCEIATTGSSLVANYHFNQGIASGINPTVTTLTDASGNNNNLTLSNFGLSGSSSNWVTPGAVNSGSSCPAFVAPEINVVSNALSIPDGNTVTSTGDNTDFGNISSTGNIVRTYTIQNTGGANLAVTTISMSGADASSFTLGTLSPASPITASNSAVFSLTFAPSSTGTKSAVVNIISNDCDEATYDFVVTGTSTVGAAFTFDGTNDYINCGNILTASYTKEAWVKFSTSSTGNNFLSAGNVTNGSALWAPGIYNYSLSAGHDGAWSQVQDNVAMVPGNWYHIAVTYDAPSLTMVLYKNGVAVSTNNNVLPFTGTSPLHIGAFSGTFVTTGSMDEVRIWNRPLCQAEIQNNMNCEIPTTAPGLIANYHFNQGVGNGLNTAITTLTDASGSSNTGTLVNTAGTGTISNWVATSTVTSGSSCAAYFTPEINLVGNGQSINDGDITPALTDHTDFGGVCVNGQIVRTFTIQNTGNANLTVSGVTMSGTSASLYTVGLLTPASPITPSNLAVFSVSFSPTSSGVKTATVTITNNDCNENPYDFVITGTCNALPVVTATTTNSVICNGASTSLNGLGADTYTWSGSVSNGISFTPSITTSYSVTGTNTLTGCTSTNSAVQTITVNANPTLTANSSHTVICNGFLSPTLTATGAGTSGTYTWNPGAMSGASVSTAPSSTTIYSVAATSSAGCLSTNTVALTVSVNALPTVTALTTNSIICLNFTTSLNGAGADTYTWTGGVTNGQTFTATATQSYSVTGTNTLTGCVSTNIAVQTITVDPLPIVSISTSNSVICDGTSATLTASGANSYTWNPGNLQGTTITPNPSVLTTYSLVGTSTAGCTSTNTSIQSISVNPIPTVTATISNSVVCSGNTLTLNGLGAATYTWSNGVADGTAFVPTATSTYTLNGTNSAGCTNTNLATVSVTVNALPQLSITVSNSVICFGDQSTLSGAGAATYSWSGGISNNLAFSPAATTEYTLSATDANNCQNTAVATITVNALPVLTVSSTNSIACEAQSTTLTVSGASSYSWNTGANTPDIVITPTNSISFTVNATDVNSCTNTVVYTQSVAPCPGTFSAWAIANNVSCSGKDDGSIAVKYSTSYANPQISYVWNPQTLCAAATCDSISKLAAGRYGVTVKITYTLNSILVKTDSVVINAIDISDQNGPCEVKVFTGISANNDGVNDVMIIENIEEFPNNKVTVFNRWGQLVFEKKGYNNTDIAWPTSDEASKLNSNTYFYVIDLGNGSKIMKGWVEIIKN